MLDQDESVSYGDKAITEDCPPPPEFHILRADVDDIDDDYEDDVEYKDDGEYWEDEGEMNSTDDGDNNRGKIIYVTDDDSIDKNK
ncbi:hypothetical protein RJ641_004410 [Dillenia turbinata]|uniref:Uncharacterized protein n=1 Tax=Dillenia turbinata TaxID=194707 RepID=A0AAN8Z9T2_9MAGN